MVFLIKPEVTKKWIEIDKEYSNDAFKTDYNKYATHPQFSEGPPTVHIYYLFSLINPLANIHVR